MKPAGKRAKTCNQCEAREIMYTNQWQARENIQPVPSGEKQVTSGKCGKACNQWQARGKLLETNNDWFLTE